MIKKIFIITIFFLSFMSTSAYAKKVKLFLNSTYTDFIMVEKQDCKIHKNKDNSIMLGLKFGNFLFSFGPEVRLGQKVGIDWHKSVQAFISRYQALCSRFNSGSITKEEYVKETENLDKIEERMANLEKEVLDALYKKKDDMFDSLDHEATRFVPALKEKEVSSKLQKITKELEIDHSLLK